jgi:hypothetical protein
MPRVHIQLLELHTDEKNGIVNRLWLFADASCDAARHLRKVKKQHVLQCTAPWTFKVPHQANEQINMLLMKRIVFGPNRAIGRCVLPLDWFPTNRVVREWFPMTFDASAPTDVTTWLLLDVHVEDRKIPKFQAAFANLRIIPTWPRPVDSNVECIAPPQVVFVLPQQTADGEMQYAPVAVAQYPSPEVFQTAGVSGQTYDSTAAWLPVPGEYSYPSVRLTLGSGGSQIGDIPPLLSS